jgi:protocatechuate 3,4-dioxygenase beta subunit
MMKALLALLGLILVVLALLFPYGGQAAAVDGREALLRSEAGITSIESGSTGHTSADGERGRPEAASAGRGEDPLGGVPQRIAAMDPEAWTVRGVIIDSYGEPVPGAMIGDAEDNAPVACDDEGSFVLQHAPGLERLELLAMAPQHTPKLVSVVRDPAAQHADIGEVRMLRGASLSGLVQGPGQVPFAGAKVRLLLYRSSDGPTSEVLRKLSPVQITGSRGEYSFEHLVPGFYGIDAVAEGMQRGQGASLELDDGKRYEAQTIVLVRGYRLRGRVVDVEGAPIADARVGARTGIGAPRYALVMQTDADGRFEMAGAPPAELSIGVSKEGYLSQSVEADPTSAKELEIQLEPGLQITGIVTSAETRAPVESFAVTLRRVADVDPRRGSVTQQLEAQIQSWRDQALSSTDPEQRKQRLARSAEFEERLRRVREMARTRPVAILRGPGSVAGAPAEGKPEQGADSMQQEGGVQSWPKGRFTLEGLSEGIYVVGIRTGTSEFCYAEHPPVELRRHAPAPRASLRARARERAGRLRCRCQDQEAARWRAARARGDYP